jgi:hypothetical protein
MSKMDSIVSSDLASEVCSPESENPPRGLRWVLVGFVNEPRGRHLYGFDHHHFRVAKTLSQLIGDPVLLAGRTAVNPSAATDATVSPVIRSRRGMQVDQGRNV